MAEVKKARLFLRRGTDTDRKTTPLCEGELGYSTDAFRVVVGTDGNDGTTNGGRAVGTTVFVSGGALQNSFHTRLTEASAGGYAMKGDFAVAPASGYHNAAGVAVSVDSGACTVMVLTAAQLPGSENQSTAGSWVAINSGIPYGNVNILDDDIKGDKIHGGDISGDVTFSGTTSTTIMTGTSAFVGGLQGTGNRSVIVTSTGQLTATTDAVSFADGTLNWVSPISVSAYNTGAFTDWRTHNFTTSIPHQATTGLFQFVWDEGSAAGDYDLLMVRSGVGEAPSLSAVYEGGAKATAGGSSQFSCPLSSDGTVVGFDWRMLDVPNGVPNFRAVFNGGFSFSLIGYM